MPVALRNHDSHMPTGYWCPGVSGDSNRSKCLARTFDPRQLCNGQEPGAHAVSGSADTPKDARAPEMRHPQLDDLIRIDRGCVARRERTPGPNRDTIKAMARTDDTPAVVTDEDRERMRRIGAWKASLPPLSPPPPRTLKQVFEMNEELRRTVGDPGNDDDLAVERHVRFRANLLRLHSRAPRAPDER